MGLVRRSFRRLLRSPWFWIVFILAQVFHPAEPYLFTLWTSFGTQHDSVDVASLHGRRSPSGDLLVECELERSVKWFGTRTERVTRELVIPREELATIQHRYRMAEPMKGSGWTLRDAPESNAELPVVLDGLYAATEFEALTFGPQGTGWTSGWEDQGDWLVGYRMRLPLGQDGNRPWASLLRVLLTPFALLADLLALPAILARLVFLLMVMGSLGGH